MSYHKYPVCHWFLSRVYANMKASTHIFRISFESTYIRSYYNSFIDLASVFFTIVCQPTAETFTVISNNIYILQLNLPYYYDVYWISMFCYMKAMTEQIEQMGVLLENNQKVRTIFACHFINHPV